MMETIATIATSLSEKLSFQSAKSWAAELRPAQQNLPKTVKVNAAP